MSKLKARTKAINAPVAAPLKKKLRTAKSEPQTPQAPVRRPAPEPLHVDGPCSFYHEGGHGDRYWSNGWRFGIIREMPIKGQHKEHIRIEVPVKLYGWDPLRGWYKREELRVWVHRFNVNEAWDFVYHGAKLREIVAQRAEAKAADVAKAAKRVQKTNVTAPQKRKAPSAKRQKSSPACLGPVSRAKRRPARA